MANNIQIVGNIINSTIVSRYNDDDIKLLSSQEIQKNFGDTEDYIEYYVYDAGGNLLNSDINYKNFKLPSTVGSVPYPNESTSNTNDSIPSTNVGIVSNTNTQTGSLYPVIEIDPVLDLQNLGYTSGEFSVRYNFFTNKISSPSADLFIKEISPDRTEIGVISTTLSNEEIEEGFNLLTNEISSSVYFSDYLLNFGNNQQALSVNLALNKLESGYEIYFKLYEPLPENITEKTSLWVVDEKVDPYVFNINLDTLILPPTGSQLRGPNFNIPIEQQGTISTGYENYNGLLNNLQSIQSSSYSKILNLLSTQSIDINVDYTNFSNFSFFGSAEQRLKNFYTKVKQIEDYNNLITTYTPYVSTTSSLQLEILSSKNNINDIISKFDGFEYYLYFESSSYAWPKSTSTLPYTLFSTSSLVAETWYNNYTSSAKVFDENNVNSLKNSIPAFLLDDCDNNQYLVFLDMIGQYFDNIWIFLKSITDINDANNNLEQGVSKDLVYHVLKSYGIRLYNSQEGEDLNQFLIGSDSGSVNFDDNFSPTGSYLNNIPRKDLLAEIYKRIYHNLPYLVKNKGTVTGIEGLITTFGITGSILNAKEFGGGTKSELLKGYNNEKVRIIDNIITGSVLSPFINLNQPPTSSIEFRDDDLHYLDISFSPQTQIDTYISGAIASNNPSFNLDDYIGDPRQQYSSSYSDLDTQRKLYFETGVTGYAPFTGSNMDYNGFIRLIQFFDNALFKMIEDFIPARTSLSTGITINSPVLERNKVSYSKPILNEQEIYDADFEGPTIQPQYGFLYNNLTGSKEAFYNGELSGSQIDIYNNYFLPNNIDNFYLHPTSSLTPTDINNFNHSEFNVLLNNISGSRPSLLRKDIEFNVDKTGSLSNRSILSQAELQDSYESLISYNNSRYDGTKITSKKYNEYNIGDNSFGKSAVIDHNVRKIGLFTQIESSSFFPQRNNIALKYLVDENGNLTELNQRNKNWEELQNTFIAGDSSSISLFDNQKFSDQKTTDGVKSIYNSGYSYSPVFYLSKNTKNVNFRIEGFKPNISVNVVNSGSNENIVGYSSNNFPLSSTYKIISNFGNFDNEPVGTNNFFVGAAASDNPNLLPTYISSVETNYDVQVTASIQVTESVATQGFVTYELGIFKHNPSNPLNLTNSGSYLVSSVSASYVNLLASEFNNSSGIVGLDHTSSFAFSTLTNWDNYTNKTNTNKITIVNTVNDYVNSSPDYYNNTFRVTINSSLTGTEVIRISHANGTYYDIIVDEIIVGDGDISNQVIRLSERIEEIIKASTPSFNTWLPGGVRTDATIANLTGTSFEFSFKHFRTFSSSRVGASVHESFILLTPESSYDVEADVIQSGNIIIPKGTRIYKYTLKDIDLSTGVGTTNSLWSKSSEIKLVYKLNPSSTESLRYIPTAINNANYVVFSSFYLPFDKIDGLFVLPDPNLVTIKDSGKTLNLELSLDNIFLGIDEKLTFILKQKANYTTGSWAYRASFNQSIQSNISITSDPNIRTIVNDNIALLDPVLSKRQDPNNNYLTTLYISTDLSEVYKSNLSSSFQSFFAPNVEGDVSDLYSKYGDIDYKFNLNKDDSIVIRDSRNYSYEFGIKDITMDPITGNIGFQLLSVMDSVLFNELFFDSSNKRYFEILYLNKVKDETNILCIFPKKDGKTSYGFIIPENLHPEVLSKIDTITKEVKQKLLADQQGSVNTSI